MTIEVLKRSKKALKAVKLFNPMYLKSEPPIMVLEDMVDDLRYFGIDDFDDQEFLNKIKNELPEAIRISKLDFDWDSISESKAYIQRVKRRKRKHRLMALVAEVTRREAGPQERVDADLNENIDTEELYHGEWIADEAQEIPQGYLNVGNVDDERANEDWLKDPGEVGRRILEWWKKWFRGSNPCPNIQYAISLMLLAQPHSAAMERVFSQLT